MHDGHKGHGSRYVTYGKQCSSFNNG